MTTASDVCAAKPQLVPEHHDRNASLMFFSVMLMWGTALLDLPSTQIGPEPRGQIARGGRRASC